MTRHAAPFGSCAVQNALDIERVLKDKVAYRAAEDDCKDEVGLYGQKSVSLDIHVTEQR